MRKPLSYVLGVLLGLTILVYGLSWYGAPRQPTLAELQSRALEGDNEDEQERAALELAGRGPEAIPNLRTVLAESKSPRVQAAIVQALGHLRDWDSMPVLLDKLDSEDQAVRHRAGHAVSRILGADFNFRAGDSPDRRARVVKALRAEYDRFKDNPPSLYQKVQP